MFNAQKQTKTLSEFNEKASVASELKEEVTAHAQRDSLEDAREVCADGTYFPNNLRAWLHVYIPASNLIFEPRY
jgi:hypothetical protein